MLSVLAFTVILVPLFGTLRDARKAA